EWLSPIDFRAIQQNHFAKCAPGTGHWLLANVEFERWMAGQIKTLWCPGNPGVGKTMLASTAVDHLRNQLSQPGVGVACIFFDYNTSSSQNIANIFGSVLRQLLINPSSSPGLPNSLYRSFKSEQSCPNSLNALAEALQAQIQLYSHVHLVVDALDECSLDIRDDFISTIRSLTELGHLSVLITSRHISAIAQEFMNETRINVRAHDDDVLSYINYRIHRESRLKAMIKWDATLELEIVTQVTQKAAGMFLLVRLHLDSLASKNNLKALRDALAKLPKDIHRSYDDTMARIMDQGEDDANLACQVFLWLTYAKEPLTVEDLQYALAISPGMTEMNPDAITDLEIITSVCTGLVIIEENRSQKYFRLKDTEAYFEVSGKHLASDLFAHFHIVATCITYLGFQGLKTGTVLPNIYGTGQDYECSLFRSPDYPLLQYSVGFWGYHAGQCENMLCSTPRMASLLQKHLEESFKVPLLLSSRFQGFDGAYHASQVLGRFSLLKLTSMLLDCGVPVDSKDLWQQTVLFHAVQNGHVDMVKWLLVAVNEIGIPDQRLFNINDVDNIRKTLLHHALKMKHPAIAEFLLSLPGINADVADIFGWAPLSYAAKSSHIRIVDLLCRRADVNPNSYDEDGNPALYYAIQSHHVETVKILLRHPNINVGPFQLSLHRSWVDPDSPLKVAAQQGHVDIVDLLLKHPDIDPNWKGRGNTPLGFAIVSGHLEVVKLLLQHSDIQPNLMPGPQGMWVMPPLSYAVRCRSQRIMETLLQHPDVDINCKDSKGRTPLAWAALGDYGELNIVHQVLELTSSSGCKDCRLCTPLSYAVVEGYQDVVKLLLEHDDFYGRDREDVYMAKWFDRPGPGDNVYMREWLKRPTVVHLLLPDQKNLDPSSRHRQHFTTLIDYALRWGYTGIAALLGQHVETEDNLGADSWK
ncbi:ankyrin repeat-containing domain protein, partial [Mycena floridula]